MMIFIFQFATVLGIVEECDIMEGSEFLEKQSFDFILAKMWSKKPSKT